MRPKTAKGTRLIPLVPWTTEAMVAWADQDHPNPHGLVWPVVEWSGRAAARMLGRPRPAKADAAAWLALQERAGVAPTDERADRDPPRYELHEARHTTATLLMEARVDERVVQAIMGHTKITTTTGTSTSPRT